MKKRRLWGGLGIIFIMGILMSIPRLLAGDILVQDLKLEMGSKGNIINATIKDHNIEDSKVVLPIPEGMNYLGSTSTNVGITEDKVNHQLVIDWVEEQDKIVHFQLEASQIGTYNFSIHTVRDGEPVVSSIQSVTIEETVSIEEEKVLDGDKIEIGEQVSTSEDEITSTEQSEQGDNQDTELKIDAVGENEEERSPSKELEQIAAGKFGTSAWELDSSGVLTIGTGEFEVTRNLSSPWLEYRTKITQIVFSGPVKANQNSSALFRDLYKLREIKNLEFLDTSNVTDMSWMFCNTGDQQGSSLEWLDVSHFDTSNVTNMADMFNDLSSIKVLDVSNFNTSNVSDMHNMFANTKKLEQLDLSNFDTSKVTTMLSMFNNANSIADFDVSNFNTSNVSDMQNMFANMTILEHIDLSGFNTSKVKTMDSMFANNKKLNSLDLSSFDTSNVSIMKNMFMATPIHKIILGVNTFLHDNVLLNIPSSDLPYTGNWRTVGDGEDDDPKGEWSGTTDELYSRSREGVQDIYVWEYLRIKGENVTVHYLDTHGNTIAEDTILSGNIGESYEAEQRDIQGYVLKEIDGEVEGKFSNEEQEITYIYTTDSLSFFSVPEKLSFNNGSISNRFQEIKRTDKQWKIIVEDTRLIKSNWRVTAKLPKQFEDNLGVPLQSDLLLFRKAGQPDQWITNASEITVFDGNSSEDKELYDVSWNENEGPLLQVAPGTVKVGTYTGVMSWNLVDAPV